MNPQQPRVIPVQLTPEFKVVNIFEKTDQELEDHLNDMTKEGWQFVTIATNRTVWVRPKKIGKVIG